MNSNSSIGDGSAIKLSSVDIPRLKDLCLACTEFYELVEGQAPTELHGEVAVFVRSLGTQATARIRGGEA